MFSFEGVDGEVSVCYDEAWFVGDEADEVWWCFDGYLHGCVVELLLVYVEEYVSVVCAFADACEGVLCVVADDGMGAFVVGWVLLCALVEEAFDDDGLVLVEDEESVGWVG